MFDGVAFGKEMVGIVKGHVARAIEPLMVRLDALEEREPIMGLDGHPGKDGADGKDADPAVTAQLVADEVAKAVAALPVPQDGKSVSPEELRPMIAELVSAALADAVKAIPIPKDGIDGASVTIDDVSPLIEQAVANAAAAIPVPHNGKDGKDGRDGKDGLDAVTPMLKDGVLLFTMADGTIKEVGQIVGADGQDGEPGKDGVDGLGFDDLTAEYDGERGITLRFVRGEQVKEFAFSMPVVIDRGVWAEGKSYTAGDAVTWAGSVWIAQKDTGDKPDGGDGWRLSVKRGRDGKDGVVRDMTAKPVKVS